MSLSPLCLLAHIFVFFCRLLSGLLLCVTFRSVSVFLFHPFLGLRLSEIFPCPPPFLLQLYWEPPPLRYLGLQPGTRLPGCGGGSGGQRERALAGPLASLPQSQGFPGADG